MRTFAVVRDTPAFNLPAGVIERKEDVLVETLFSQPCIEALDVALNRPAQGDELQFHPMLVCSLIEDPTAEFRPVVG